MRVMLALYDPSQPSTDGSFWSWRAPSLDRRLLDRLYYEVAAANRPENPNQLSDLSIIGGFAKLTPDQLFAYRFGNGGRDAHGRPGRFVMIVAHFCLGHSNGSGLAAVLTCPAVEALLAKALFSRPVPAPSELEIDLVAPPSRVDPVLVAKAIREERLELSGPEAMHQAAAVCNSLPTDRRWKCSLRVDGDVCIAVVECPRIVERPAPLPQNLLPAERLSQKPLPVLVPTKPRIGVRFVDSMAFRRRARHAPLAVLLFVCGIAGWWFWQHTRQGDIASQPGNVIEQLQPHDSRPPTTQKADRPHQGRPPGILAAHADSQPEPKAKQFAKDLEQLNGTWRSPKVELGPGVTGHFALKLEFKKDSTIGQATVLDFVSKGVFVPVGPPFVAELKEKDKKRLIVLAKTKDGKRVELAQISYEVNGDKLKLTSPKALQVEAGKGGASLEMSGEWDRRKIDKK